MLRPDRTHIRVSFILCISLLALGLHACASPSTAAEGEQENPAVFTTLEIESTKALMAPTVDRPRTEGGCPGVESALMGFLEEEDPVEAARRAGFPTRGGRIQVLLELAGEETAFLEEHELEVGTQVGSRAQAFIEPEAICELAADERVRTVQLPALAAPQEDPDE